MKLHPVYYFCVVEPMPYGMQWAMHALAVFPWCATGAIL